MTEQDQTTQTWNEQLVDWMKQNPEGARRLKELVPKTTLQNWVSGTVKDPRKIRASARLKVYQLTSI